MNRTIVDLEAGLDMKARITAAAIRLFGAHGYEGASLQAIADAVGIRKQSLLHHFPSKETLHRHVVESLVVYWKNELPRLLAATESGYGRFDATMTALVQFFLEDPDRARLTVREMLDRPAMLAAMMREHLSPWARLIADYIRMGQDSGLIRADIRPESYLIQVMLMIIATAGLGPVASVLVHGDHEESRPDVAELVRIAHDSLFKKPRSVRAQ
ncbi:MAG: TetR/AcrR family transcriptional regulator [Candidatus Hydrogenedentes bacterium]|nr:TetR/AcrR family transcriptional regulator [Candidatus Hydrogenedentota bacterium]